MHNLCANVYQCPNPIFEGCYREKVIYGDPSHRFLILNSIVDPILGPDSH